MYISGLDPIVRGPSGADKHPQEEEMAQDADNAGLRRDTAMGNERRDHGYWQRSRKIKDSRQAGKGEARKYRLAPVATGPGLPQAHG